MPLSAEILRHNNRIVPCGCSWSMVKSQKPRAIHYFKKKGVGYSRKKLIELQKQAPISMYRGLHGNLRLWSVKKLVSNMLFTAYESIHVEARIFLGMNYCSYFK